MGYLWETNSHTFNQGMGDPAERMKPMGVPSLNVPPMGVPGLAVSKPTSGMSIVEQEKAEQREDKSEAQKEAPMTSRRRGNQGMDTEKRIGDRAGDPLPSFRAARREVATNAIDALGQHNFYVKSELRAKARAEAEKQIEQIKAEAEEQINELQAEARAIWEEVRHGKAEYEQTMAELQKRKDELTAEVASKESELSRLQEEQKAKNSTPSVLGESGTKPREAFNV